MKRALVLPWSCRVPRRGRVSRTGVRLPHESSNAVHKIYMTTTHPYGNSRILIIDDNRAIHDDFCKILAPPREQSALNDLRAELFGDETAQPKGACFELASAYQGQEGLARVTEAVSKGLPFAMAFVDVRMPPGWDGIETITRIWEIDPDLQIVLCTAYSDYSWTEMAAKLGNR